MYYHAKCVTFYCSFAIVVHLTVIATSDFVSPVGQLWVVEGVVVTVNIRSKVINKMVLVRVRNIFFPGLLSGCVMIFNTW